MSQQIVWVLIIHHRHGENISVHAGPGGAKQAKFDYVEQWWSNEITSEAMPTDRRQAVERYLTLVEDEWMSLLQTTVLP